MQKRKATIEIPADLARAYRDASPEKRARAERAMAAALMSREEAAAAFRELTERTSAYAEKQGLTPEKLEELLQAKNDE